MYVALLKKPERATRSEGTVEWNPRMNCKERASVGISRTSELDGKLSTSPIKD